MLRKLLKAKERPRSMMLLATLLLIFVGSLSSNALDFEYTYEGQTITYTVRNEVVKTVETKQGTTYTSPGNDVSGDLILPKNPSYDGVEYTLVSLGQYAFYGCSGLTSVVIPDGVTSIGRNAFDGCSGLTSVVIPDGVTSIGLAAFAGCSGLTSIDIPNTVTGGIGTGTFRDCTSLTSVVIPDGVTSIGNQVFMRCTSLTSVDIPNTVTSIGYQVFDGCTSLTSVVIPDGVPSIGDYTFRGCTSLASIDIPNTVTSIGEYAFYDCAKLTSVAIPDGVPSIGDYTFYGCTSLASIDIPNTVTSIGYYAFYDCAKLTSVDIPNTVTRINGYTFYGCTSLTSVVIPDGVTSLGLWNYDGDGHIFDGCTSLTSIKIPDGVTTIGEYAFSGCTSLASIDIPTTVTHIGGGAFRDCTKLTSVDIPDGMTLICGYTFDGCTSLTSIDLPSVTAIWKCAFRNCKGLTEITSPSLMGVEKNSFLYCTSLRLLDLYDAENFSFASSSDYYSLSGLLEDVPNAMIYLPKNSTESPQANLIVGGKCQKLLLNPEGGNSQLLFKAPYAFDAETVTINRQFTAGQPYTVYFPFEMDAKAYGTFYTGGTLNADGTMVTFSEVTADKTEPNTPYMFIPKQDYLSGITIDGVSVVETPEDTESDGLNGVYAKREFTQEEVDQKVYYGWANGEFCWADTGAKIDACRAYFKFPVGAAAKAPARLKVQFGEGVATGINGIDMDESESEAPMYNLNGQRVSNGYRGIVIKNGSKTMETSR